MATERNPKDSIIAELTDGWNYKPVGKCFCGCREETDGHFVSGHDTHFAAHLLGQLRGNGKVTNAIQSLIDDNAEYVVDESVRPIQVIKAKWGWIAGSPCLCGCGRNPSSSGNAFRPGHDARVWWKLLANLLLELQGDPKAEHVVRAILTLPASAKQSPTP